MKWLLFVYAFFLSGQLLGQISVNGAEMKSEKISVDLPQPEWGTVDLKSVLPVSDTLSIDVLLPQYGPVENLIILINNRDVGPVSINMYRSGTVNLKCDLPAFRLETFLNVRLRYTHKWEKDPLKLVALMI